MHDVADACGIKTVRAEHQDVRVVVQPRHSRFFRVANQGRSDTGNFICGDRHSDSRAADQHAAIELSRGDRLPYTHRIVGIVDCALVVGTRIGDIDPQLLERFDDHALGGDAAMVAGDNGALRAAILFVLFTFDGFR